MNPLILALALLCYQNSLVPNHLFPYPEVMASAEEQLAISRHMFSDSPDFYRFTWSFAQAGPCPNLLALPGDGNKVPCSVMPFVPGTPQPVPVSLWTSYQQLVNTPPSSPINQKASLVEPCLHPTWTFEYMLLYGEIGDITQAPCGLLWGVL